MARIVRPVMIDEADAGRQLSLLPDLPLSEAPPDRLHKSVAVVHMYPLTGNYSHFVRRVFNALLVLSLRVWSAMPPEARERVLKDRQVLVFSSTLKEITHVLRSSGHATSRIYDAVEELYKMEFKFDVMQDSTEVWHVSSRLITQYLKPKAGTGEIQWEYPPDIFAMLMAPRPYAAIDLMLANNLRSGYSLALYENTSRYLNNPGKLTARLAVEDWMRLILGSTSSKTFFAEDGYRYFKSRILKRSMAELARAEACIFTLELIEAKGPKNKVTSLQFRLVLKAPPPPPAPMPPKPEQATEQPKQSRDPAIEVTLRKWGVSEKALQVILQTEDDRTLKHVIAQMEPKVAQGKYHSTPGAFIDALRRSKEASKADSDEDDRKAKAAAEAERLSRERHHEMTEQKLTDEFERARRAHIQENFNRLPDAQQDALFEAYLETQEDANFTRMRYAQHGLEDKMVAIPFCAWLGRSKGYVSAPEFMSFEAFKLHRKADIQALPLLDRPPE